MTPRLALIPLAAALAAAPLSVSAQGGGAPAPAAPPPAAAPAAAPTDSALGEFGWLAGCWRGQANNREFREHWMPPRGALMLGTGHTVNAGRTQDYEYMRLEPRADGIHYVAQPSGQKEASFRLGERTTDGADTIYTFANPEHDFPQRIVYRRGSEGWLYIHVEGKLRGEERRIIYPLRRIDCETGDLLRQ